MESIPDTIARRTARNRWLLLIPALAILLFAASGPLLITLVYSVLTPGDYGGVEWQFSLDAWFNVFMQRDIFDDTLGWSDAHLSIFWRSVKLSALTTLACLAFGFPTAYFIATRPKKQRDLWMLLIIIPFWTNLLIRTFAILELIRNEGTVNTVLIALGLIDEPIQMLFTEFSILLGMVYVYLPLMVLPIYASMERFDFRLVEAGYDLYATRFRVLRKVILPLVKPGVIAGSILVFVPSLGAYVTPRVMGGGNQLMIGNLIELQFGQGRNWPLGAALSITLLAIVMVALLAYVRVAGNEETPHG
ncbi:ABC transporter permease [Ruegeria pomeroyi]|uniref:Spermidine/putrescine ABC transporter, permease protein n=2 Tax=Ruegeria pomeroyi TaxID=89184 RepID=Q5LT06_RUEPO|nr:ABC transporter permease [Ruegeria pomeroyi]AAV94895.1 spermidine/putrescine ABC transporter, permease protein [Ruegeria pomeroyi DSS-3]NVK96256.1 ABC transporter permease [Ruegeria pomeroyi]NVL02914.1 ABC transporter permease [Ruegeria pomeroyi]QWV08467.1 ABC transporter permease [Ruegeria pomeroyi]